MSKPAIHGRDHRPGRSDTVPGIIVYHYENTGDYLNVLAQAPIPGGYPGAIWFQTNLSGLNGRIVLNNGTSQVFVDQAQLFSQADVITFRLADQSADPGDHFAIDVVTGTGYSGGDVFYTDGHGRAEFLSRDYTGFLKFTNTDGNTTFEVFDTGTVVITQGDGTPLVDIDGPTGAIDIQLGSGRNLTVNDSGANPIFRIDETDGSVHIKTGSGIVADL